MFPSRVFTSDLMTGKKFIEDGDDQTRYVLVKICGGLPVIDTDDAGIQQVQNMTVVSRARAMKEATPVDGMENWRIVQALGPRAKPDVELWDIDEHYKAIQRAAARGEKNGMPRVMSDSFREFAAARQGQRLKAVVAEAIVAVHDPAASAKPVMPLAELEEIQARLAGPAAEPPKTEKRHARPKRSA